MLVLTPMMLSFVAVGAFFRYYYEPTFGLLEPGGARCSPASRSSCSTARPARSPGSCSPTPGCGRRSSCCWCWPAWSACRSTSTRRPRSTAPPGGGKFRTITFPYIRGLLLLALLFRTIEAFKLFDVVFLITDGGPGTSTETIAVYVYRLAFQYFRTSQSSALVYILLFIVIVLTNLYLYFVQRRAQEA